MKKRILALVLTVLLLAGISVVSTSAATSYNLWVGGVKVTKQNAMDVLGDGKVRFDYEHNILTLVNADIKGAVLSDDYLSAGIYAGDMDLTIMFRGTNTVTDAGGCPWSVGIGVVGGDLTIHHFYDDESASLTVKSGYADEYSVGLYSFVNIEDTQTGGDLYIKGGNITVGYEGDKLSSAHGIGVLTFDMDVNTGSNLHITGAPTEKGYSYGLNACGDINVMGNSTRLTSKGSQGVESHGIYSIEQWYEFDGEAYFSKEGNLNISHGAKVYAEGDEADVFSVGVNLQGGINCADTAGSLTAIGGDTKYTVSGEDSDEYSSSYGINTFGNLVFAGGIVNATAGYGYDSCGINALTETEYTDETEESYIALKGDVTVSGAKVTAASNGGYVYSDGMYVGGDLLVTGGSFTASGGVADAQDTELQTESNGIFANNSVSITGGTVTLSCKEVTNGSMTSCAIFSYEPVVISEELTVQGAKTEFLEGDTLIVPGSFDAPVVISKVYDFLIGDVNEDGDVNIKDATAIQKHLAEIEFLSDDSLVIADFNQDEDVSIKDATAIQKYLAGLPY
ncbi:MAG: hypothetical protein IJ298_07600 [Ruminococcus sp.]|nr:hypothetical protein [Ruminococcus sp.]